MNTLEKNDARAVLEGFILRHKAEISPSKCPHFNAAVSETCLRDKRVIDLLRTFENCNGEKETGTVQEMERPQLLAYIRGVKNSLKILLQAFRKSVFIVFSDQVVTVFDDYYSKYPLVADPDAPDESLWAQFGVFLQRYVDDNLEGFSYDTYIQPFFRRVVRDIENSESPTDDYAGNVSSREAPSLRLVFAAEPDHAEVLRLFNPDRDFTDQKGDKKKLPDNVFSKYAETAEEVVSTFARKNIGKSCIHILLNQAAAMDKIKSSLSINTVLPLAMQTRAKLLAANTKLQKAKWLGKKDAQKKVQQLEEKLARLDEQVLWYAYGCLQCMQQIYIEGWRRMASKLKASHSLYNAVALNQITHQTIEAFFDMMILNHVAGKVTRSFNTLVNDLMNEAVIKEFASEAGQVKLSKGKLTLKVDGFIKQHKKFSSMVRSLLNVNPALEPRLIACPSVAGPLAAALSRASKSDPASVRAISRDTALVKKMETAIRTDYPLKRLLATDCDFFELFWAHREDESFIAFLAAVAEGPLKVRKQFHSSPRLYRTVWSMTDNGQDKDTMEILLNNPAHIEHIASCGDDQLKLLAFLKDLNPKE